MKILYLIIFYSFFTNYLYAQFNQWSSPVNLSDSLNDNQNIDIAKVWYNSSFDSIFAVWEQVVDDSTTRLLFRNITSQSDIVPIQHQQGVQYTNPKFMPISESTSGNESVFYIFYQTNPNNNQDIYYVKYFEDKTFSQPIPFATTQEEETNLNVGMLGVVWQCSDSLFLSTFDYYNAWSQPELIDSGNCSLPVICGGDNYVYWLKSINDTLKIYFKHWIYQTQQWSNDSLLFGNGTSSCISNSYSTFESESISWKAIQDSINQIYFCYNPYYYGVVKLEEFLNLNKYEPTHLVIPLITTEDYYEYPLASFILDSAGKMQVMANDDHYNSNNFQNLSGNSILNRNPKLFEGEWDGYYLKVYLVWESFQNNHWQLKMRNIQFILASIENNADKNIYVYELFPNYPNPFNPITNIKFEIPTQENVTIEIFNLLGQKIETLLNRRMSSGSHEIKFTAQNLPSGIYLYTIKSGQYKQMRKMIYLK